MDIFEYNRPVKKDKLTKEQKEFLDNNYKGAVNIGDKLSEATRKNPFSTLYDICKDVVKEQKEINKQSKYLDRLIKDIKNSELEMSNKAFEKFFTEMQREYGCITEYWKSILLKAFNFGIEYEKGLRGE